MTPHRPTRIALSAAASLAAVGALAACGPQGSETATAANSSSSATNDDDETQAPSGTASSEEASEAAAEAAASGYADGEYAATGNYVSPGGAQQVAVELTLADGVVTAVEVTPEAQDPRSEGFQKQFASGIEAVVVGVPLDELAVDKVSGSSLTSTGFNEAIEQIKVAARA